MMERIKIINGRLITPYRIIENGTILIENGKIIAVGTGDLGFSDALLIDA